MNWTVRGKSWRIAAVVHAPPMRRVSALGGIPQGIEFAGRILAWSDEVDPSVPSTEPDAAIIKSGLASETSIVAQVKITVTKERTLSRGSARGHDRNRGRRRQSHDLTGKTAFFALPLRPLRNKPFCDGTHKSRATRRRDGGSSGRRKTQGLIGPALSSFLFPAPKIQLRAGAARARCVPNPQRFP